MPHWLVKSEPNCFSWDQHAARGVEPWTGVRNHLAKRHLCDMRLGELALFYHSTTGREAVGLVEVVREAYPDPTDPDGRWVCVDLRAVAPLLRASPTCPCCANPASPSARWGRSTGTTSCASAAGPSDTCPHARALPPRRDPGRRRTRLRPSP